MGVLKIEMLGSDVLRKPAAEIAEIGDDLRLLVDDMFQTMHDAEGIGLAGPQVGVSKRVIVVDLDDPGSPPFALINPRIVEKSKDTDRADEGCLSIPGIAGLVTRPASVVVEGLDIDGHPMQMAADGLLARCLQHEIDHLDGVLFIDHLSPLKRDMLLKKYRASLREPAEESGSRRGRTRR